MAHYQKLVAVVLIATLFGCGEKQRTTGADDN
jgi:hypothetical protein